MGTSASKPVFGPWLTTYLHISFECDTPILEAVFHHYPCKTADNIWETLCQSPVLSTSSYFHPALVTAINNAGWGWHCDSTWERRAQHCYGRIDARLRIDNGCLDQIIRSEYSEHNEQGSTYFELTFAKLVDENKIVGWQLAGGKSYTTILYRKIDNQVYFKLVWISGKSIWHQAREMTHQLTRDAQDGYRKPLRDSRACESFEKLASLLQRQLKR